ncbi:MAG: 1-acyl-sn-glycerol-3-phosphate acyltransferase [bacterium]|nr:1-acyl-sn-glycerol-3-phosphate acyltransferase [bacterium]
MKWRDCLGTLGAWTAFACTVACFDPVLRVSSLFGSESLDRMVARLGKCLTYSIDAGLCHLDLQGLDNVPNRKGVIVVGNHQSLVESFVPLYQLRALSPRYVAKEVLGRCFLPSISFVLRRGGHCLIDRQNHDQAIEAITKLGEAVNRGEISAIIFPEGTRSLEGNLQHFRTGGLRTLLQTAPQAPVMVMVVHNGNKIYPKGLPHVTAGTKVSMRFLPLIERASFSDNEQLIEHVHNLMVDNYRSLEESDRQN